jgi:hypothetical protein
MPRMKSTKINQAGAFRCCIHTVVNAYKDLDIVSPGTYVKCKYGCTGHLAGMHLDRNGVWKAGEMPKLKSV